MDSYFLSFVSATSVFGGHVLFPQECAFLWYSSVVEQETLTRIERGSLWALWFTVRVPRARNELVSLTDFYPIKLPVIFNWWSRF